jgi:RecA/RadA recombinase
MKFGVMFGNPETTTEGNTLKFYEDKRRNAAIVSPSPCGRIPPTSATSG